MLLDQAEEDWKARIDADRARCELLYANCHFEHTWGERMQKVPGWGCCQCFCLSHREEGTHMVGSVRL